MGSRRKCTTFQFRDVELKKNMNTKKIQQNTGIKGVVTAKRYRGGTVAKVVEIIEKYGKKAAKPMIEALLAENFLGIGAQNNNLVVSSLNHGRNLIAQHMAGDTTYPLEITYGEIGTSATAPANADTALGNATVRRATDLISASNNVVNAQFFFSDMTLPDGTYNEFGTFTGGTITLGSGQLFNHALFSPAYEKATGEDTTIEVEFTIN